MPFSCRFQLTHSRGVRPGSDSLYWESFDFNSRTHVECDLRTTTEQWKNANFNSRTHVECDFVTYTVLPLIDISTHALTWSATLMETDSMVGSSFQLTHSRGVRPSFSDSPFPFFAYFNSRTHVECDKQRRSSIWCRRISTHALTWSATSCIRKQSGWKQISTHALTWSATKGFTLSTESAFISTHALTWSATFHGCRLEFQHFKFQLTHSRGVRRWDYVICSQRCQFQLTHSRGVRHLLPLLWHGTGRFQLTHSRGVRRIIRYSQFGARTFQLTHSRGVRRW